MSYASVIKYPINGDANYIGVNGDGSHLSYKNDLAGTLNVFDITTVNGGNDGDLGYLKDYLSTTRYTAENIGNLDIQFASRSLTEIEANHVALAGLNFESADIQEISIEFVLDNTGSTSVTKTLDVSDRSVFYDNKPLLIMHDAVYNVFQVRLGMSSGAGAIEPISLTQVQCSRTLEFPNLPKVGFKKGKWNTNDEPRLSRRQNNAFGASTIKRQGTEESVSIPVVPYQFMDTTWSTFLRNFTYAPCFFCWNLQDFPFDVIYGNIEISQSVFTSSLFSEINFKIKGVI